ncbi:MmgE/PrpD family protein [Nesterenkonia suensis]
MTGVGATQALAEFICRMTFSDLSAGAVRAARTAIMDGVASMCAGGREPVAQPAREVFLSQGGVEEASVAGLGQRLPASNAAYVNAVQLHCLDFEVQGFPPAHGTSSILPAALAIAERDGLSGADLVTAFAVGWEIQQRVRAAGDGSDMRSFHPPGVVGPLGAAAAASHLVGFTPEQTAMALGHAASNCGGLFANNGTGTKATHPGRAARVGVESALLVGAGLTANPHILEDRAGFLAAFFASEFDGEALTGSLGEAFRIEEPGYLIKPYPAEVFMQFTMQALVELRDREGLRAEDIARVQIVPALYHPELIRPEPASGLEGKFSYEFCAAVALTEERVTIQSFSDAVRLSPAVQELLPRVEVHSGPRRPPELGAAQSTVTVVARDGRQLRHTCRTFPGMPQRPLSDDEHLTKVMDCLAHAGLDESACLSTVAAWGDLDAVENVQELMRGPLAEGPPKERGEG